MPNLKCLSAVSLIEDYPSSYHIFKGQVSSLGDNQPIDMLSTEKRVVEKQELCDISILISE